jgi:hypothetical protein
MESYDSLSWWVADAGVFLIVGVALAAVLLLSVPPTPKRRSFAPRRHRAEPAAHVGRIMPTSAQMSRLSDDKIALPEQMPVPEGALVFWIIWDHPEDFPTGYLLRAQIVVRDIGSGSKIRHSNAKWYADNPEKLRAILPPGLIKFARQEGDPPHLLETWMA